ncbi:MAG: sigma-70 family RNA polymerase sigma factor [Lentisphaeria bacterium]|nr:sigma-70 family RNA polymerase sigma factor [Lentisphaeria bacterium]
MELPGPETFTSGTVSSAEGGRVLRLYMEQLEKAVPLSPEDETRLWETMDGMYLQLRRELAFCGFSYSYAIRLLEQLDAADSLNDIFPQSLISRRGSGKLLRDSRELLGRFSEIHGRLRSAFPSGDPAALDAIRAEGAALMADYPFHHELILALVDELRSHRLVVESGETEAKKLLTDTVLFCSCTEFSDWFVKLEKQLDELNAIRNRLVFGYLRLVFSIARKFQGYGVPLTDLLQEGNIGLMRAIDKFDSGLGHRFSTYATWWIKQCVCLAVGRQSRVIRLPMHMLAALNKINKAEQQFLQENGREAAPDEIAERLGMTRERVSSLKRMAMQSISLQAPVYSGKSGRDILLEDTVENNIHDSDDPMRNLAKKILSDKLTQILSSLPPRTRKILTLRYGLDGTEPMSLNDMSRHFKISRERIRQIENNALAKMRNPETISLLEDYFS